MPQKPAPAQQEFITKAGLKGKRGWTDKLCNLFLPKQPHSTAVNKHYKSGPEVNLYLLKDIIAIEETQAFSYHLNKAAGRRKAATAAVQTKQANIMQYVNNMQILVPLYDKPILLKRACDSYNRHKQSRLRDDEIFTPATVDDEESFLHRITINFLRHKCTRYEAELKKIFGKIGNAAAYEILKQRVNEAIIKQYNWLA